MRTEESIQSTQANSKTSELQKLEPIHERHQNNAWREKVQKFDELRRSFSKQRTEVFSSELRDKIRKTIKANHQSLDLRGPGIRYNSLIAAQKAGVDLSALKGIHDHAYQQIGRFVKGYDRFRPHETVVGSITDIISQPPIIWFPLPDPDKEKLFYPPFGGSWDRFEQNQASGDGAIVANNSYLDGTARLGSKLVARNHDASDVDLICAYRETGYLVRFKTLRTGILQVKADLSALICRHNISTDDEWGWSDFHATTRGRLVLAVFWNWEDVDPANEVSDQWFVAGLDCSGDGESFPGESVQAVPGERRIINLFTTMAFPANQKVWVYVGLSDQIWAFLNDVSIDISIDSAWLLNSLAIRSI
jgi:hypothetical protein